MADDIERRDFSRHGGAAFPCSTLASDRLYGGLPPSATPSVERDYGLVHGEEAPQYFAAPGALARAEPAAAEMVRIPGDPASLMLALWHQPPVHGTRFDPSKIVLFVHGSSFPSALAAACRFDGRSWMDDLSEAGFDVWALDFGGYGHSDRYPEMRQPARDHLPLGRADVCSRQVAAAVDAICKRQGAAAVSVIAHSWGTLAAGICATRHPATVACLVLFGPLTRREEASRRIAARIQKPAYAYVTIRQQRNRFFGYVPPGNPPVFEERHFAEWAPSYLDSDAGSRTRVPASVQVPNGPTVDVDRAWSGSLAYDPAHILCPTLIIRGEWDSVTTDRDALWLYRALLRCPLKHDVVVRRGTHVMHLETSRFDLYRAVRNFLDDAKVRLCPHPRR